MTKPDPVILVTASQASRWLRFPPMTPTPGKPNRWRKRATEIRALAEQMRDQWTRDALLRLATDYDQQAEEAEKGARRGA